MTDSRPRGKVFVVSVDEPLRPLAIGPGYFKALLVVRKGAAVLGHVLLPALEVLPVDVQRAAIAEQLGETLWRLEAETVLRRALGLDAPASSTQPSVSVVVCTRDRPDDLERCLTALGQLATPPLEVLVVDNAPSDERGRQVCERFPVRYVVEPLPGQSRARNRGILETSGELVAFTDDDCVVDPGWLDGLGPELEDVLVQAVTGYVGPLELDAPAQYLFEAHGGFGRGFRRRVFHGVLSNPALSAGQVGAGANSVFRRTAFEQVGLFAEDLGPGTPARAADDNDMFARILDAGYRIVFDPARVVWHRHRRDDEALRSILSDYGVSSSAIRRPARRPPPRPERAQDPRLVVARALPARRPRDPRRPPGAPLARGSRAGDARHAARSLEAAAVPAEPPLDTAARAPAHARAPRLPRPGRGAGVAVDLGRDPDTRPA